MKVVSFGHQFSSDARYLCKVAIDLFERKNKIIENVDVASQLLKVRCQYTFFIGCFIQDDCKSLAELVDTYELFN